jgi:hypothetical protein
MSKWQYKVGFSLAEINKYADGEFSEGELESALNSKGYKFEKARVSDALRRAIPACMDAVYKNPSSMREDAPRAFSCSSLISYLYTQAGVWMPSLSIDKYVFAQKINRQNLKFGDLIFSNTGNGMIRTESVEYLPGTEVETGIDHVGMYLENNRVLHATKKKGKVVVDTLEDFALLSKVVGFGRVADIEEMRYVISVPDEHPEMRDRSIILNDILGKKELAGK